MLDQLQTLSKPKKDSSVKRLFMEDGKTFTDVGKSGLGFGQSSKITI